MRTDRERLQDILKAIEEIEIYKLEGRSSFEAKSFSLLVTPPENEISTYHYN